MTDTILVINTGSSSVKFSLFEKQAELELLASGKVEGIGSSPFFIAGIEDAKATETHVLPAKIKHEEALGVILDWLDRQNKNWEITVVAHRIVHGGKMFKDPILLTASVLEHLRSLNSLAPLHQPHNLAAVDILQKLKPAVPQIACFDTAFHAALGPLFSMYAVPQDMAEAGIRRYGFHGLSYEWISHVLRKSHPVLAQGRVIVAHLGNGASLCALRNGISVDTTMGMTVLEGLPMGTRCGSLDPGAIIYMVRDLKIPINEIERIVYNESGLKGISGMTNDVKHLLDSPDPRAGFALAYFCLKVAQFMGMMAVSLGGVDGIIFTGGIGENAAALRNNILRRLAFLQPFETHVVAANEERIMAMHAYACTQNQATEAEVF